MNGARSAAMSIRSCGSSSKAVRKTALRSSGIPYTDWMDPEKLTSVERSKCSGNNVPCDARISLRICSDHSPRRRRELTRCRDSSLKLPLNTRYCSTLLECGGNRSQHKWNGTGTTNRTSCTALFPRSFPTTEL